MNVQSGFFGFQFPGRGGWLKRPADARRFGFTIVELLVVISIIAVIATLATGAAVKSVIQMRTQRINVTAKLLATALETYKNLHAEWPFDVDPSNADDPKRPVHLTFLDGKGSWPSNARVFSKVFDDVKNNRAHVDTSVILTQVPGRGRMTVKEALEKSVSGDIPVGYPDPNNTSVFKYFKVQYNFLTDSVTVTKD
jgi:prepilin-type N-terminal cleavage/methylation domain